MKRLALAALLGLGIAACSAGPTQPAPSLGKSKGGTPSPAMNCYTQQVAVGQLIRQVDYLTSGEVRTSLMVPLNSAYTALNPTSCQPALAIASLKEFIALVDGYETAQQLPPSYAASFRSSANNIIANLGGTV